MAASVAGLLVPPQVSCHEEVAFAGSPVIPEIEITLAAVNAAASAARWASAFAS
jgi:hypothetical protein